MPPKRRQPTGKTSSTSASASKPTTTPRRSKLAKENNISADEEAEILDAFDLFAAEEEASSNNKSKKPTATTAPKDRQIATSDVRRCLIALNTPPKDASELREILSTIDPENSGWVSYEHFLAVAALKLHAKSEDPDARSEEVERAYLLFTKGQEREITLGDLKRVARELREEVPENVLRDMLREATGGGVGGVGMEEFEGVMRRAGVFG